MDEFRDDACRCTVCGLAPQQRHGKGTVRIVAESPAMQAVLRRVARIAPTDAGVLITGESGTGKEIVARAIHEASARGSGPFVAINCAALPAELLESELFGHARGAFSGAATSRRGLFEEADGGTLFLDEIGELPAPLQAKLLRALQEGEVRRVGENESTHVDARVIAATNADLHAEVEARRFREDLYYRLKVFELELPPLREREGDVFAMARRFLREEAPELRFSEEAEAAIARYPWPGNVRELRNAVRHGAVLAEGGIVGLGDLPPELQRGGGRRPGAAQSRHHLAHLDPTASLDEVVRAHVRAAVEACDGNRAAAARGLGIGRNTLWRWLKAGDSRREEERREIADS